MAINISIGKFSRPKILDRYIVKEVMSFVALAIAALTIMLIMQTLFELMDMLINKRVAWTYIAKLLAYRLPAFLVVTFPISLLASSELAIGRLSTDGEITAESRRDKPAPDNDSIFNCSFCYKYFGFYNQ